MKKYIFIISSIFLFLINNINAKGFPQDYYKITNKKEQKEYFFNYLYKIIENENLKIQEERQFVYKFLNTNILRINYNSENFSKLLYLKEKYRIRNLLSMQEYLEKINIIPPSMALAQAAVESGWGKSRFIKDANNIFGHWTYNEEEGILPKRREAGEKHFIRVFKNLSDSVKAYMLNLNSHPAYKSFHKKRYLARNKQKLNGLELSQTMINYSGIGEKYLNILKNVIQKNNLEKFDFLFYKKSISIH